MKTKSSAKSSSSKSGPKSAQAKPAKKQASKLDSLKGAVKNALFGSTKKTPAAASKPNGKLSTKLAPPKATPPKTAPKTVKTKGAATPHAVTAKAHAGSKQQLASSAKAPSAKAGGKGRASRAGIDSESVCREVACEGLSTTGGYCRLHYVKNWKKIKRKELILKEGKLNQYIEELVAKYPDKYIEAIRQDLADDKAFAKVIYDLDLDESVDEFDVDGENVDSLIDNIKRDFDDEGETF